MGLAALILVSDDGAAHHPLPFGLTPMERQVRQAKLLGANPILIYAEAMDSAISAALARLKSASITVTLVRSNSEAANHIHPQEKVLLYAGDAKFNADKPDSLSGSYIAVSPLEAGTPKQELIDAQHVWACVALLPGSLIRDVNGLVGDWALGPTLLRLAVQQGVEKRLNAAVSIFEHSQTVAGLNRRMTAPILAISTKMPSWVLPLVAPLPLALLIVALLLSVGGLHLPALGVLLCAAAADQLQSIVFKIVDTPPVVSIPFSKLSTVVASLLLLMLAVSHARTAGEWDVVALSLWWGWLHFSALIPSSKAYASPVTAIAIVFIAALLGQIYWAFPIIVAHSLLAYHLNRLSLGRH